VTVAAHADTSTPRSWGLRARLKAFAGRLELDRRLAAGESPDAASELARRAYVLQHWRVRHRLADGLERVVIDAVAAPRESGPTVPIQREAVLAAQHDLLRLVRALRSEPSAPVRAIAIVSLLLTDGSGPIFVPHPVGTLVELAFQAAFLAEAD
jgi:hypothetical protein